MSKKMTACKVCGQEIAVSAKTCPHCGAKKKKSIFKRWWFWAILIVLAIIIIASTNDSGSDQTTKNNNEPSTSAESVTDTFQPAADTSEPADVTDETTAKEPKKTEYRVGDMLEDGNMRIVFMSSGDYAEDNAFLQPGDGNKYIFVQFAFENISEKSDVSVSAFSFECYADGYAANQHYLGDDGLSAKLSAGRSTTGYLYFEVPVDAEVIEIEYEPNVFSEKKIKFVFEGEKDSGYVQPTDVTQTEDAYHVGDIVESDKLKITYLSCEEYISDNMFITPAEGYHFISCEFEFENLGDSDEYISSLSFDCYADGNSCDSTYIRDDNLSATLSAGRKTRGTVTFEVPVDAQIVEVEYLSDYWTTKRVVFIAN